MEKILDYKFKRERKTFYEGAHYYKSLEDEAWKQKCRILLETFFSKTGKFSGVITFPDTSLTARGKPWENVINTLKDWCKISNSGQAKNSLGDATGLILRNYDVKDHLKFCRVEDDDIKDFLTFNSFEKKIETIENIENFLVFNPSKKIIFIIRMVASHYYEQLKGGVFLCIDDVILLSFLLRDELKNSGVIVSGLVVYSGENTRSQSVCIDCDNFIVSSKIFDSVSNFDNLWEKIVDQQRFKRLASDLKATKKNDNVSCFESVAIKMVGYLAHLQFTMPETSENPVLPVNELEPVGNIYQAELLLDKYQMEIAYSDEKRVWLSGDYGTGKTVVALKKLELLDKGLKEEEVIYYVSFSGKSQLYLNVIEKYKTKEKVKVIKGGTSLSNIVNTKILPDEKKCNTKNIHLIVDEYDSQNLSKKESTRLYQIIQEQEQFKNSTVLIAAQPIQIDRIDYFTSPGKKKEYAQTKHILGRLKHIMKIFELKYVMRTTVQINDLIQLTKRYLNNKTNQYECERRNYSKSLPKLQKNPSKAINNTENKPTISDQNPSAEPSNSYNFVLGSSSTPSTHASPGNSQEIINLDELYKLTSTSGKKNKKNLQSAVTKYCYKCKSEIGHSINGPLPKLIKLRKSSDPYEQIVLIAFLLLEIIEIKSKKIAIIHFDETDPLWYKLLFKDKKFFPGVTVTEDFMEFSKIPGNVVLVNNYNFVKGLEFSKVLLILDSDEYHLKQYIPEVMARCMNDLAILVISKHKRNHNSETVADLVNHWEKINETGKRVLEMLSLKVCYGHTFKKHEHYKETHWKTDKGKYISYKIHKGHESYKGLSKEVQQLYQKSHLEERHVSEDAKAM